MKITKGTIAICGKGTLGLITQDKRSGKAYIGIHLTDKIAPIGSPWQSENPKVIGHTGALEMIGALSLGDPKSLKSDLTDILKKTRSFYK